MYYVGWLYFCVQELLYLKNCRRCQYLFTYTHVFVRDSDSDHVLWNPDSDLIIS